MRSRDERWRQLLPLRPAGLEGCRAMTAEKIGPLASHAQLYLIDRYAPGKHEKQLREFLLDGKHKHCLTRLYLGRRRHMHQEQHRGPQFFSLRNPDIHVDQAEELHLPCEHYAEALAESLAVLPWKVRTNGADVEFVLGASREVGDADDFVTLAQHPIWMLNFGGSRPITEDESGLESIARAFWRNDPYYPRPHSAHPRDRRLWVIFAAESRRIGKAVARTNPRANPRPGEDVVVLCALVDGGLAKMVQTKDKWTGGGHF
ncbi:hypothetical protein E4U53_005358 [Claviceps sorghi]|nr:hypothetical protein E4U53_005358 [Claviceps sorghi]